MGRCHGTRLTSVGRYKRVRARACKDTGMSPPQLVVRASVRCNAKTYSKGKWAESGVPRVMVNVSRDVAATEDPCTFLDFTDGAASMNMRVPLEAPVGADAQLRFDLLPLTRNAEGAPCRCKSGSAVVDLHTLQAYEGKTLTLKLVEVSDPHLDRGTLDVHVTAAEYPVQFDAAGAAFSSIRGKEMSLRGLQVYWDTSPGHGMQELRRIHTPAFEAFPGGAYGMTYAHVASDEAVLLNLAHVALVRTGTLDADEFVDVVERQRASGPECDVLLGGMRDAGVVFAETCKAVATAYLYMTDHRSTKTMWPFAPAMDQMGEQFGQSRATQADDCEGLGHEIYMLALELAHGPGRLDGPRGEWHAPLLRALAYVADSYVTCMTTWGVSAAALSGRPEDASHMTCHISTVMFPAATFVDMLDAGKRSGRTHAAIKFLRPCPRWTRHMPVLFGEGTGQLHPDLLAERTDTDARARGHAELRARVPEVAQCVPLLYGDTRNPDLTAFYKALVSAFVPPGTLEGVVDVWFGSTTSNTYGVATRDVVEANMFMSPCLKLDAESYAMCSAYAAHASVPPALCAAAAPTPALVALVTELNAGPACTTGTHGRYFVRAEWLRSLLPALKRAREHVASMRATTEPLVKGVTVVRLDVWFK